MIISTNKRLKKQYVIGGSGIFDTIGNLIMKIFTSDAAKLLASSAAKEVGQKAGQKLTHKLFAPKTPEITQTNRDILSKLLAGPASDPVAIQKLVKKLNGGGVKVVFV